MTLLALMVAMTPDGVIAEDGRMPWHLPTDLKRFKDVTMGHPIIMGRKTFEDILVHTGGKPLPGRRNIVMTKKRSAVWDLERRGATAVLSYQDALSVANGAHQVTVIGGGEIYQIALPTVSQMHITFVDYAPNGGALTRFPAWDETQWKRVHHDSGFVIRRHGERIDSHPSRWAMYHRAT